MSEGKQNLVLKDNASEGFSYVDSKMKILLLIAFILSMKILIFNFRIMDLELIGQGILVFSYRFFFKFFLKRMCLIIR